VQAIAAHRELKNCVVTFWVMSQLFNVLGASRDCADFREPTVVFRFKVGAAMASAFGVIAYTIKLFSAPHTF